jgi:hypothetical protein
MNAGATDPLALLASAAEGRAPVGDRLTAMLFLAVLLHAMVLLGVTFIAPDQGGSGAPGMEVLLVTEDIPESRRNDAAAYVAQRAQKGSGNTTGNVTETPASIAAAGAAGTDAMDAAAARRPPAGGAALTSSASDADIRYYANPATARPPRRWRQRARVRAAAAAKATSLSCAACCVPTCG